MSIHKSKSQKPNHYDVVVRQYSKIDPSIRIQRSQKDVQGKGQAQRIEKKLKRMVSEQIKEKEGMGIRFDKLFKEYQLAIKKSPDSFKRPLSPAVARDYIDAIQKYFGHLMKFQVEYICRSDIQEGINKVIRRNLSRERQRNVKNAIRNLFEWAISNGKLRNLSTDPTEGLELQKRENEPPPILTIAETKTLLKEAYKQEHKWRFHWALALNTGMRSGELYALRWEDVDFETAIITVQRAYKTREKRIGPTKNRDWRKIPINGDVMSVLKELKARFPDNDFILPHYREWQRGNQSTVLKHFLTGIGVKPVKFHSLRACFATHAIQSGVQPAKVMSIGGWSDLKTMQFYIRLAGVDINNATDELSFLPNQNELEGQVLSLTDHRPRG